MTFLPRMSAGIAEQRANSRYDMSVPVLCRWRGANGERCVRKGTTRDISTRGVFVLCTHPPEVGLKMKLQVLLPALQPGDDNGAVLRSEAQVVRVDNGGPGTGFAAVANFGSSVHIRL